MRIASIGIGLWVIWITGCAATSVRTPTPAAQLRAKELLAIPPSPNDRYYILFFGSETFFPIPRYTHTWATVVKVTGDAQNGNGTIQVDTISWLPATLEIRPLSLQIEKGVNLNLHSTMKEMLRHNEHIVMWGPYEIWVGSYRRFITQKEFMESGQVGYQCVDTIGEAARTGRGCDCIHAISDMDPLFGREHYGLLKHGVRASQNIVDKMLPRPIIIDAPWTHDWLIPRLGLNCYPIFRRNYYGPVTPSTPETIRTFVTEIENNPRSVRRP